MADNDYWNHTQPVGPEGQPVGQPQPQAQPQQPGFQSQVQQPGFQSQAQQPQAQQPQAQQPGFQSQAQQPQAQQPQPVYVQVPYQSAPQPPQKSHKWIVAIVAIVCMFILAVVCVGSCTSAVGSLTHTSTSSSSLGNLTGDTIAIIDLDGTIQYDGSACSPEGLKELLDEAEDNTNVKAVVLRVNSGGGTATAGEEMAEYVRQFSEVKPIVVSSASINASAAYEISSQADYIYVARSTEIGAIGTAMELTDISGLLDMLGVNMEIITSSDEKDSSYGYRPLTDQEREQYQHMVDQINDVFVQNVADGRGMPIEKVRALATGMPFTGIDAVENGLADAIGTREDAIAKAAELAGTSNYTTADLYFPSYSLSYLSDLLGRTDTSVEDLIDLLKSEKPDKATSSL